VLGVSPSGYYAWQARPAATAGQRRDRLLRVHLAAVHARRRGTYGSPRLHRALRAAGHRVGRNRVMRLMRVDRLVGKPRRRFRVTTLANPQATPAVNQLNRAFAVATPNRVWGADITSIPTRDGWLYLAVVLDLGSRRIVGWATRPTLETDLVVAALQLALGRRRAAPQLHHSDQGSQYTSDRYRQLLHAHGVQASISRPGNCYDNAPVESFFHTLKHEIGEIAWSSRRAATQGLADYIEHFYNRERLHSALDFRSPAAFEAALEHAV
jgi:putative transposase